MSTDRMTVCESGDYEIARQRLMQDPIVQAMAAGIGDADMLSDLTWDTGNPRFEFMQAANAEYIRRGGTDHAHLGCVAEAILRLL